MAGSRNDHLRADWNNTQNDNQGETEARSIVPGQTSTEDGLLGLAPERYSELHRQRDEWVAEKRTQFLTKWPDATDDDWQHQTQMWSFYDGCTADETLRFFRAWTGWAASPNSRQGRESWAESFPNQPPALLPEAQAVWDAAEAAREQERHAQVVREKVKTKRVDRDADKLLRDELFAQTWREPASHGTLAEELLLPDPEVTYRVDRLMPVDGNVTLTAQYKTGKTTMVNELVRSLVDNQPFLGQYQVNPDGGRVAIFNYEVAEPMYRRWLRDQQIENPDRVVALHLRGKRLPLTSPQVEDWVVRWLSEREVTVWVVDPFARAYVGCGEENDNTAVGAFLDTLDVIKDRAGVRELILPLHTGRAEQQRGEERARAATRLDDWADARWVLTRDTKTDHRFLWADGRDVKVQEQRLSFDQQTRRLTAEGEGTGRAATRDDELDGRIIAAVTAEPGIGKNELHDRLGGDKVAVRSAADRLVQAGRLKKIIGANKKHHLHPPTT
ncbi:AAA family ATPase [Micromonospora sp. LH3U1]|uniref:AAA family ATPase n=1 Tax=Micromonospora sp. LH3U1 TaxID=3018339 RepID=UPI00234B888C|nr:AAA family ATPase [Micromonospora sp. LH3U1]WCN80030.1 AAA family ATPase [Micromonospora sp. LH3U1]